MFSKAIIWIPPYFQGRCLICFLVDPVLTGSETGKLFECAVKIFCIVEAALQGNVINGLACTHQQIARFLNPDLLQKCADGHAGGFPEQTGKIILAEKSLRCQFFQRDMLMVVLTHVGKGGSAADERQCPCSVSCSFFGKS